MKKSKKFKMKLNKKNKSFFFDFFILPFFLSHSTPKIQLKPLKPCTCPITQHKTFKKLKKKLVVSLSKDLILSKTQLKVTQLTKWSDPNLPKLTEKNY